MSKRVRGSWLVMALTLGLALGSWSISGCDEGSSGEADGGTSGDADTDTDVDTDADSDSDSDDPVDPDNLCAEYPEADNNFATGSVPRNYTFFDNEGTETFSVCSLAEAGEQLLLVRINADGCSSTAGGGLQLAAIADTYADDGVVVLETLQNASVTIDEWVEMAGVDNEDYASLLMTTDPRTQLADDYKTTQVLPCGMFALVDLTIAKVVDGACGDDPYDAIGCIDDALEGK